MAYPVKGTAEYHIGRLKKLRDWLARNPSDSPLVTEECEAVEWALELLDKHNG